MQESWSPVYTLKRRWSGGSSGGKGQDMMGHWPCPQSQVLAGLGPLAVSGWEESLKHLRRAQAVASLEEQEKEVRSRRETQDRHGAGKNLANSPASLKLVLLLRASREHQLFGNTRHQTPELGGLPAGWDVGPEREGALPGLTLK